MKNLLILLLTLGSTSAFSNESCGEQWVTYLINHPAMISGVNGGITTTIHEPKILSESEEFDVIEYLAITKTNSLENKYRVEYTVSNLNKIGEKHCKVVKELKTKL